MGGNAEAHKRASKGAQTKQSMNETLHQKETFAREGIRCSGGCSTCPHACCSDIVQEIRVGIYNASAGNQAEKNISHAFSPKIIFKNHRFHFEKLENISDILDGKVDMVLYQADAMNLEDSLFPATKIMDMPIKCLINLENYEALLETQHSVRRDTLSSLLGIPVIAENSQDEQAQARMLAEVLKLIQKEDCTHARIDFGRDMERALAGIDTSRYIALRLLEKEDYILPYLPNNQEDILKEAKKQIAHLEKIHGKPTQEMVRHARRAFIKGALHETLVHSQDNSNHSLSQKIDSLLTNRWTGLPLLLVILLAVFECSFALGAYPQAWIEQGISSLNVWLQNTLAEGWLSSMLMDGIIKGVGAVISFLPNIVILFFFLTLMEDSGYLSRAAFLLDKLMHRIGLHGKSFVPMLIGFGCNVPAILAAKEIEDRKDRILTMLMIPFMSCSARLPVYMLLVSAIFPRHKALVMISLYLIGILVAIGFALLMKRTRFFRKEKEDYVSELPEFSLPSARSIFSHIWERTSDYLKKITNVILVASIAIWALEYFPKERPDNEPYAENSALAITGKALHPLLSPLGFDWKMSVCLITGLPAKEAIVSSMGILYGDEKNESNLIKNMREERHQSGPRIGQAVFTPASALSFMVFVLLYFPCLATIQTLRREISGKWAAFSVINSLVLAYLAAFVVFRIISLFL
jgi:ferrous iron transport protein B